MKKKIKKVLGKKEICLPKLKKLGKKYKKSPELQLATVLVLGVLAGGLILFGFSRDSGKKQTNPVTPALAHNIAHNQTQLNE